LGPRLDGPTGGCHDDFDVRQLERMPIADLRRRRDELVERGDADHQSELHVIEILLKSPTPANLSLDRAPITSRDLPRRWQVIRYDDGSEETVEER